jgi:hypothetical protein
MVAIAANASFFVGDANVVTGRAKSRTRSESSFMVMPNVRGQTTAPATLPKKEAS